MRNPEPPANQRKPKSPKPKPVPPPAPRRIRIRLAVSGTTPPNTWVMTIDTDRFPALPARLFVLQLPSQFRNPRPGIEHLSGDEYEIVIELEGPALPAELVDLSTKPANELVPAAWDAFLNCPAAIAILIIEGRVSVAVRKN